MVQDITIRITPICIGTITIPTHGERVFILDMIIAIHPIIVIFTPHSQAGLIIHPTMPIIITGIPVITILIMVAIITGILIMVAIIIGILIMEIPFIMVIGPDIIPDIIMEQILMISIPDITDTGKVQLIWGEVAAPFLTTLTKDRLTEVHTLTGVQAIWAVV